MIKTSEYSPYDPISINKEATEYFQRGPFWNVICKYCGRENPGKNETNPWGAVRQDNLTSYPKACPKCKKGGLPKLDLKPGLKYNNCVLIEELGYKVPHDGYAWLVRDLESEEEFIRYSYRLRARETWHK